MKWRAIGFLVVLPLKLYYTVEKWMSAVAYSAVQRSDSMESNFRFLEKDFPVLAQLGKTAEKYLYSDSNSCLMKLGMIGETIVNLMFTYDRINLPQENSAVERINVLAREGLLTRDLVDIFHALRKIRNKAVHENYESVSDGKALLQMAYSLCEWLL